MTNHRYVGLCFIFLKDTFISDETISQESLHFVIVISLSVNAQTKMEDFIVNDQIVSVETILQLEKKYGIKCLPGNYWYDMMTGAFGIQGGPCTGIGIAGLQIGGKLKANASAGTTNVFINGRELHFMDVQGLQTFIQVIPGRYWMDAYGNFGFENYPMIGNLYVLYKSKFAGDKKNSYYKSNPWSGESTSFGSDGEGFMYFSSKKSDGTTIDYFSD
ncbi:MAG: hypothetical protein ABIN97_06915 [Ginsengibacter sp.]